MTQHLGDDPKLAYKEDLNVMVYRMGILETTLEGLGLKLDTVINKYPTNDTLKLILDPIRDDLKDLKAKSEEEAKEKVRASQQVKFLSLAAFAGPIATFIITMIVANALGVPK